MTMCFPYDNIFFTADTHFMHENIIRFCNRPFASNEIMTETLVERWNARVRKDSVVFHLGDIGFFYGDAILSKILDRLNGKIYLILGNHDKFIAKKKLKILTSHSDKIAMIEPYMEIDVAEGNVKQRLVLFHYPILSWKNKNHGAWHLHGHSHGTIDDIDNYYHIKAIDVGVDVHDFSPISYDRVADIIEKRITHEPV